MTKSTRRQQDEMRAIRRKLAEQGFFFNGDKFTSETVLNLQDYCNQELFGKSARRPKSQ